VIDFATLTSNSVKFELAGLPKHYRVFARVRAFTECSADQNKTIQITLDANTPNIKNIASMTEEIA
jgi:hypothetical protein